MALAAQHPAVVSAVGVVASPAEVPTLDPPAHRDGMAPAEQERLKAISAADADEAIALLRPEYEAWRRSIDASDPDDMALSERWVRGGSPADRAVLERRSAAELAATAREALVQPDGYLRDVAAGLRPWAFRPADVQCPALLWYGDLDENVSPRNGEWLAERLPRPSLRIRHGCGHLAALHDHWDEILSVLAAPPADAAAAPPSPQ